MDDHHSAASAQSSTRSDVSPDTQRWTNEEVRLLRERKRLAWTAQHAYYERASILSALSYLIGIPVVIVVALAGSAIVAGHTSDKPVPLWVGIITVSATVLASLQTFLRFGERAAFSAVAGAKYAHIRRRIEDLLIEPPGEREKILEELRQMTEDAEEQSPPIGERRWLAWEQYAEHGPPRRRLRRAEFGAPDRRDVRRSARKPPRRKQPQTTNAAE